MKKNILLKISVSVKLSLMFICSNCLRFKSAIVANTNSFDKLWLSILFYILVDFKVGNK